MKFIFLSILTAFFSCKSKPKFTSLPDRYKGDYMSNVKVGDTVYWGDKVIVITHTLTNPNYEKEMLEALNKMQ